jgi:hypothetical protein
LCGFHLNKCLAGGAHVILDYLRSGKDSITIRI